MPERKSSLSGVVARKATRNRHLDQVNEEAGKEATQRLNADVPLSLYKRVRVQAADENRTIRELLIDAVEAYLESKRVGV